MSLTSTWGFKLLRLTDEMCGADNLIHSPWALALGTPVLVVAGLGHVVQAAMLKRVRGARCWSPCGRGARSEDNLAMSREYG